MSGLLEKWNETLQNINLQGYEERLDIAKQIVLGAPPSKNSFLTHFNENGTLSEGELSNYIKNVSNPKHEPDMNFIVLIRFLYLNQNLLNHSNKVDKSKSDTFITEILNVLKNFPFWPHENENRMSHIIFWSENHLLMTLGSAHLYHQYINSQNSTQVTTSDEDEDKEEDIENITLRNKNIFNEEFQVTPQYIEDLLIYYLSAHAEFGGVYEVLSHVYLPYSLTALLNLYDFSLNKCIRKYALKLINIIVDQLCLALDPVSAAATLSASARAFPRTRERNTDHNINQLHYLLIGKSPNNKLNFSQILDFLLTTRWRPLTSVFEKIFFDGFIENQKMNHKFKEIPIYYRFESEFPNDIKSEDNTVLSEPLQSPLNITPLLWSCGLIANPNIGLNSRRFIKKYNLKSNKHLWPIYSFFMSASSFNSSMKSYSNFSLGQSYLDIKLNLYKKPNEGLILSSFEGFNKHLVSFQQLVWMCNFNGVPIYSQSGSGDQSFLGFGITDTHTPCVLQHKSLIVINFYRPDSFKSVFSISNLIFSTYTKLTWPKNFMSKTLSFVYFISNSLRDSNELNYVENIEDYSKHSKKIKDPHYYWIAGQRGNCFAGILCTSPLTLKETSTLFKYDYDSSNHKLLHNLHNNDNKSHSWVVVCDTRNETYQTLEEFCSKRLNKIQITHNYEGSGNRVFHTHVYDPYYEKTLEYNR